MMMLMVISEANELERGRTLAAAAAAAAYTLAAAAYVIPRLHQGSSVHILSTKPFIFLVKIDVILS
jgi:cobalamin biosynthesis protein CbiD